MAVDDGRKVVIVLLLLFKQTKKNRVNTGSQITLATVDWHLL